MKTFHREKLTGHTVAILEEITRCSAMVCDASRCSKSQENGPFHRSVWQGLMTGVVRTGHIIPPFRYIEVL